MIKLEICSTRSIEHGSVYQFFRSDLGIDEYIKKNFIDTKKIVGIHNRINEDYSKQTKTFIFQSKDFYDDFVNDKILEYQEILQDRYNKFHNITLEKSVTEI